MAIDVIRLAEDGQEIEFVEDIGNRLPRLLPSFDDRRFPLLRFVDRYGNTVFNRMQVEELLEEWRSLYHRAESSEDKKLLHDIEALAKRCLKEPHLYLKFEGD